MEADDASAVGGQRFRVTERLRALQDREGIARLGNLRAGLIVGRDDEGDAVFGPPLWYWPGRVQIAWPTPNVLATRVCARIG